MKIGRRAVKWVTMAVLSLALLAWWRSGLAQDEKQEAEFVYQQERLELRALEETWQAMHAWEHHPS